MWPSAPSRHDSLHTAGVARVFVEGGHVQPTARKGSHLMNKVLRALKEEAAQLTLGRCGVCEALSCKKIEDVSAHKVPIRWPNEHAQFARQPALHAVQSRHVCGRGVAESSRRYISLHSSERGIVFRKHKEPQSINSSSSVSITRHVPLVFHGFLFR